MGRFLFFFVILFAWGVLPQKPANRFVNMAPSVTASAAETRNVKEQNVEKKGKDKDHLVRRADERWMEGIGGR